MFQRGLADMLAGRYASGCPALAESLRLDPRPGTLFTLAECESRAGLIASALDHYESFLRLAADLPPDAAQRQSTRRRIAAEQRAILAARVSVLTIQLPRDAPAGTVVKRDAATVSAQALAAPMNLDPGPHAVTVAVPGAPPAERRFVLGPGERKELAFSRAELAPRLTAMPLAGPSGAGIARGTSPPRWRRWGPRIAIAGLVLAAAGGAALWIAENKIDAIERARVNERPFDVATGDYPTYQAVGAGLLVSGTAALLSGTWLYLSF